MRPEKGTYPDYYEQYVALVKQDNVRNALIESEKEIISFFNSLSDDMGNFKYGEGKWSIKEVFNHIIDTERIFAYRVLRFARKDEKQPLSFDQNEYVANAELGTRPLKDLVDEFEAVRKATISLFKTFSEEALLRSGQTATGKASVNAIGFVCCGHAIHHINIIRERYLKK